MVAVSQVAVALFRAGIHCASCRSFEVSCSFNSFACPTSKAFVSCPAAFARAIAISMRLFYKLPLLAKFFGLMHFLVLLSLLGVSLSQSLDRIRSSSFANLSDDVLSLISLNLAIYSLSTFPLLKLFVSFLVFLAKIGSVGFMLLYQFAPGFSVGLAKLTQSFLGIRHMLLAKLA